MALDSPIKFHISLAETVADLKSPSHGRSVFPSYFAKFTEIFSLGLLRHVIASRLSISISAAGFFPVSRSIRIV